MATTDDMGIAKADGGEADSLLLWILVWSELIAFGVLLVAFMVMSMVYPDAAARLRSHLNPGLAAANTVILVLSGWQAALAVRRSAEGTAVRRPLVIAAVLGLVFVTIKLIEYATEVRAGVDGMGALAELYVLTTGFHLLHVFFGSGILLLVAWRPSRPNVVMITTLWHAIDLVWLVMFPIVYLT